MSLYLPGRDIGNKFLFGHFMMRPKGAQLRKMEGPCYGRVNYWCSDQSKSFDEKLATELDYMEQVGCYGYMIELCAHTSKYDVENRWTSEIGTDDWFKEVKEKYNTLLKLIQKHRKMWLLVSVFNDNAWQRHTGLDEDGVKRIIKIVQSAGHADLACLCPVAEPETETGKNVIKRVHAACGGFKLLKFDSAGDSSTSYWRKYITLSSSPSYSDMTKTFAASDNGSHIAHLVGQGSESHKWVPKFPNLDKGINFDPEEPEGGEGEEGRSFKRADSEEGEEGGEEEGQQVHYDYRGVPGRTSKFSRACKKANATSAIYYAWGYDGNHDGVKGGDSHCKPAPAIDVYAICATVVGYDETISDDDMDQTAKDMVAENGGSYLPL